MVSVKRLAVVGANFFSPIAYNGGSVTCEIPSSSNIKPVNSKDSLIRDGKCTDIHRHGHWSDQGGYVTLINATPYDWNLTSLDPNHMKYEFPELIRAGKSSLSTPTPPGFVAVLTR